MALQIGTVDGLVYISEEKIRCFVNAIKSFSNGGVNYSLTNNVSIGTAFQRYVDPVYNKKQDEFDLKNIATPVFTNKGAEQSPARVTYCKKMGLLNFDEKNYTFNLTPVGNAIYKNEITISEYAFLLISKLGVFQDQQYVGHVLTDIASYFIENIFATDVQIKDYFVKKYNDGSIEKTRIDVILGALEEAKLLKKFSLKEGKGYIVSGLDSADVFNDFRKNSSFLAPAEMDSSENYVFYIGNMENGVLDIINDENLSIYEKKYPNLVKYRTNKGNEMLSKMNYETKIEGPLQQIFYGAPGTGKSHKVKELTGKDNVVRTTFHPDSDYSSFVGCYKPTSIEVPMRDVTGKVIVENGQKVTENRIVYEFVEQAFLKAYIKAWKMYAEDENNPDKQYLVIEEINRGNCAQIFGDLFQLLDRGDNGFSEYPINADKDMQKHLAKAFMDMAYLEAPAIGEMNAEETARAIRSGEKLILPSNLYIWATMNTSDQSLFPIDSAFKRRWDWQYVPIHDGGKGWQIEADGKRYDWWKFVDAMNDKIGTATYSEDKKLGYFFCKAKDGVIDAETFVGKVIFYIWNDVFKDFAEEAGNLFKDVDGSMLSFNKFYTIGIDGKRKVVEQKIAILMQNLGVEPITTSNSTNDDEPEEDEDGNNPSSYNKNYDKFSVNGEGKWGKNRLPYECLKKYVEMNPGLNANEVLNNWKSLNVNVPHFVESKEEYESRTDNSKRSYYVKCGDTIIYVAHNGYGSNGKVYEFMDAINNANWGIKLAKVMA